jgi:hypothetical protein
MDAHGTAAQIMGARAAQPNTGPPAGEKQTQGYRRAVGGFAAV